MLEEVRSLHRVDITWTESLGGSRQDAALGFSIHVPDGDDDGG